MFLSQAFLQWSSYVQGNASTRRFLERSDDDKIALFKICVFVCTPSVHVHTCIKKRSSSLSCHPPCFWNRTSHSPKSQLIRLCLAVPRDLPVFAQASLAPPQYSQDRCVPLYLSGFLTWDLWDAGSHPCRSNTLLTELGALILSSWVLGFLLLIPFILWTLDIQFIWIGASTGLKKYQFKFTTISPEKLSMERKRYHNKGRQR